MRLHGLKKMTGLGVASLCLAWSGLSYAGQAGVDDYTTVSKASVKIKSYEQAAPGVVEKVTVKTDDVVNYLTHKDAGTKPAKNLQLVLFNYCGSMANSNALGVWDKDTDALAVDSDIACLGREGPVVVDEKKDRIYTTLDINSSPFGMGEIDMSVQIKQGKVKKKVLESQQVCLSKFKTLAMGSYYDNGDNTAGSRVLRKTGSIKTNGQVMAVLDGWAFCD